MEGAEGFLVWLAAAVALPVVLVAAMEIFGDTRR